MWQSEKLPQDVLAQIFEHLFEHRCVCKKFFMHEVRHPDIVSAMRTCRKWRGGWKRLIVHCVRADNFPFCLRPIGCYTAYSRMHAPHPFYHIEMDKLVTEGRNRNGGTVRDNIAQGGEAGGRNIVSSLVPEAWTIE